MRYTDKDKEVNMFITTFAFKNLNKTTMKQFEFMFDKVEDFKNEFVHFIRQRIYKVSNNIPELIEIQQKIDNLHETEGKVSKDSEKKDELKELYRERRKILKKLPCLGFNSLKSDFMKSADLHYKIWLHDNIRSNACNEVISAYEKYLKGMGKEIHYQNYGNTNAIKSVRNIYPNGKKRSSAIQFEFKGKDVFVKIYDLSDDYLDKSEKHFKETGRVLTHKWLKIKLNINKKDLFQLELFNSPEYGESKLVRIWKNNKYEYRLQLSLKKISPKVQSIINPNYKVAIDFGTETAAVVRSDGEMFIEEIAPNIPRYTNKIAELDVYMEHSKIAMNPEFYRENGTRISKREAKEKGLIWVTSNRYKKAKNLRKTIYAKQARRRKKSNELTTKKIYTFGNEFATEDNNFKAWGMKICRMNEKAKKIYDNGIRKSDYPKQQSDRAVAQIPTRLESLCKQKHQSYEEITGLNLSTLNHFTGKNDLFTSLKDRIISFDETLVKDFDEAADFRDTFTSVEYNGKSYFLQRDLYAASKMLFCYYKIEKQTLKSGKEIEVKKWYFDNIGYSKWFDEVFYSNQEKYIFELMKRRYNGEKINGTILG